MNWNIVIQALGTLFAAIIGMSQIMNSLSKSRSKLKHDLEVLNLINKESENYQIVKNSIDAQIKDLYMHNNDRNEFLGVRVYSNSDFFSGAFMFLGGSIWTLYLISIGGNHWLWLSGLLLLLGLGGISNGLTQKDKKEQ